MNKSEQPQDFPENGKPIDKKDLIRQGQEIVKASQVEGEESKEIKRKFKAWLFALGAITAGFLAIKALDPLKEDIQKIKDRTEELLNKLDDLEDGNNGGQNNDGGNGIDDYDYGPTEPFIQRTLPYDPSGDDAVDFDGNPLKKV